MISAFLDVPQSGKSVFPSEKMVLKHRFTENLKKSNEKDSDTLLLSSFIPLEKSLHEFTLSQKLICVHPVQWRFYKKINKQKKVNFYS
jgi:hypothetical protein